MSELRKQMAIKIERGIETKEGENVVGNTGLLLLLLLRRIGEFRCGCLLSLPRTTAVRNFFISGGGGGIEVKT